MNIQGGFYTFSNGYTLLVNIKLGILLLFAPTSAQKSKIIVNSGLQSFGQSFPQTLSQLTIRDLE